MKPGGLSERFLKLAEAIFQGMSRSMLLLGLFLASLSTLSVGEPNRGRLMSHFPRLHAGACGREKRASTLFPPALHAVLAIAH